MLTKAFLLGESFRKNSFAITQPLKLQKHLFYHQAVHDRTQGDHTKLHPGQKGCPESTVRTFCIQNVYSMS